MARSARIKLEQDDGWYHLYCRSVGGKKGDFPLTASKESAKKFVQFLRHFSNIYFCEVAAYCVMGNHYHIVVRFDKSQKRKRLELRTKAEALYPNSFEQTQCWDAAKWKQFSARLHDVSEFMRNINMAYTRWYNKAFERRGRLWAERFQSTLLYGPEALLDCMQYIDLNPIRAGLVAKPEDWEYSSMHDRYKGDSTWLKSLDDIAGLDSDSMSNLEAYKELVYIRGEIQNKDGQSTIYSRYVKELLDQNKGIMNRQLNSRVRHFTRGLVVGSADIVEKWLQKFLNSGRYQRRKNIMPQYGGECFSLR